MCGHCCSRVGCCGRRTGLPGKHSLCLQHCTFTALALRTSSVATMEVRVVSTAAGILTAAHQCSPQSVQTFGRKVRQQHEQSAMYIDSLVSARRVAHSSTALCDGMAAVYSTRCPSQKNAVAVAHCKRGKGILRLNGTAGCTQPQHMFVACAHHSCVHRPAP